MLLASVPDWWRNRSSPACCVMLAKTTGAPSTNPPAVIGRCCASKTADRGAPVLTPIPLEAGRDVVGLASWAQSDAGGRATNPNMQRRHRSRSILLLVVGQGGMCRPRDEAGRNTELLCVSMEEVNL